MSVVRLEPLGDKAAELKRLPREAGEEDLRIFERLCRTELTDEQRRWIVEPDQVFPRQRSVLAIHWHPEFVPMDLVRQRVAAAFPNCEEQLIVPTQHNVLETYDDFAGVEADCFHRGFKRKVQLLIHFANEKIQQRGDVFKAMLAHTYTYRAGQLWEFFDSLIDTKWQDRVDAAADRTGAGEQLIEFVRVYAGRLRQLAAKYETSMPQATLRNKLIRDYFDELRGQYDDRIINHAQVFLRAVKEIVKANFSTQYFYRVEEMIEEARSLGAGVVIPHPEQFWPILLADLDVDGIEVWNPQSFEYTEFLVHVVNRENHARRRNERPILITMGDDCHLGEKLKHPDYRDEEKASREIGYQPPWENLTIRKALIVANAARSNVIREYKSRLL
jgi:hypothetical protein